MDKTDGTYQKKRLEEMASMPVMVTVRPRHPTHMQHKEKGTACYGQLLQSIEYHLKYSGRTVTSPFLQANMSPLSLLSIYAGHSSASATKQPTVSLSEMASV